MPIRDKILELHRELPSDVVLVAVSKFHPAEAVMEAYDAGQRVFGESRPQELSAKAAVLPEDIQWHFIGHLQTNKLKMVLPYASLVQSVDSLHLLEAIDEWGARNGKTINVLMECHIAAEATKQGFSADEIISIMTSERKFANVCFCGLMGMATFTDDEAVIRADFSRLLTLNAVLQGMKGDYPNLGPSFGMLSFGMSDDYGIAVDMGSNMVRIGTAIFGARQY